MPIPMMHLVDTTMFFCHRGGGVKQYLLAKHAWLKTFVPPVRHTLLVPVPLAGVDVRTCSGLSLPLIDGYRFPLSIRRWRNALRELQPDLIEAGDPYAPGIAARDVGQRLGIPAVAFFHSDLPRMLITRLGSWTGPVTRTWLRNLYNGFDLVLAPSRAMLDKLDTWGVRNAALQPLGVNTAVFEPALRTMAFRRSIGLSDTTRLLVYAGRFAREKNVPVLMRTVEKLGDPYHLLLVGAKEYARVSDHVTMWPYQRDPRQLAQVLASCDALVHAGDAETFGLIALEAMACGLPVVAVAIGGIRELIDDTVGVLAQHHNSAHMAQAISALFERDLASIGRAARARVARSHSWDAAFRGLVQRYAKIAGRSIDRLELLADAEH
jgi:alpha-1,6-mannosyltransferase